MKDRMKFAVGKAIKAARLKKRLTQMELARKLSSLPNVDHFTQGHLSRIENGTYFPPTSQLQLIANVLGCSVPELWAKAEYFDSCITKGATDDSLLQCLKHPELGLHDGFIELLESLENKTFGGQVFENVVGLKRGLSGEVKCEQNQRLFLDLKRQFDLIDTGEVKSRTMIEILMQLLRAAVFEPVGSSVATIELPRAN